MAASLIERTPVSAPARRLDRATGARPSVKHVRGYRSRHARRTAIGIKRMVTDTPICPICISTAVVDEDRRNAGLVYQVVLAAGGAWGGEDVEVVVVVAGDGEVPHGTIVVGWDGAAIGGRGRTVGRLQGLAELQLGGLDPLLGCGRVDWNQGSWAFNLRTTRDEAGDGRIP
jgi:hypothetical protein